MERSCGVLAHITSLPSPYGIGTLGKDAEEFVNVLRLSGQKYWQVLPVGPAGYGNSPYQSYSVFAGEPMLIDLDDLVANGLLDRKKCEDSDYGADPSFVDFEKVRRVKMRLLREAFASFSEDVAYLAFAREEAAWLDNYALFMAMKEANENAAWDEWEDGIRFHRDDAVKKALEEHSAKVNFWKFTQYFFLRQWEKLKRYANKNGVKIIGDIPIYTAYDSADVWSDREMFLLDSGGKPTKVAGVPPDYFSKTGQLWGNPLYDWQEMKKAKYLWWTERFKKSSKLYDMVRVDHFRAFDTYYAVPYGEKTAINGKWEQGPGTALFDEVKKVIGDYPIIAEDLGEIFESVRELLRQTGFPGMKILQFGFNPENKDSEHLPHNYKKNLVVYTGTHDNSTMAGWFQAADRNSRNMAKRYVKPVLFETNHWACIRSLYAGNADLVIIPVQDLLGLDDSARMNLPGTVSENNWIWRMKKGALKKQIVNRLKSLTDTYFR
ncbi:MAG: 4-alpha-glucanotransferase [Oscillospiraceae bacterium]|jgi:4-alpha-glucanotransferase|nr:4-alpha-glucanotransferase [Oscillospiraceae bacterium]